MSPRSFILLGAATLVCVLLAGWSVAHRAMPGSGTEVDKPLVPDLASRINDVALVSVTADGQTTTIRQGDKGWTVDQAGGYPADASKIQALALALANTHLVEAKTAQEKLLPRLDLGDPTGQEGEVGPGQARGREGQGPRGRRHRQGKVRPLRARQQRQLCPPRRQGSGLARRPGDRRAEDAARLGQQADHRHPARPDRQGHAAPRHA